METATLLGYLNIIFFPMGLVLLSFWIIKNLPSGKEERFTGKKAPAAYVLSQFLILAATACGTVKAYLDDNRPLMLVDSFTLGVFFATFLVWMTREIFLRIRTACPHTPPAARGVVSGS
jgi:hypothetical protein